MNHIQVQCGQCARRFKAKAQLAGKRVKCPSCAAPIPIPAPEPVDSLTAHCSACATDFRADRQDAGLQIPCPACGVLVAVGGQRDQPAAAVQPSAPASVSPFADDTDPLGIGTLEASAPARKYRGPVQTTRFGETAFSGGDWRRFWPSGVVAAIAFVTFLGCMLTGHLVTGLVFFLIGLAIAGIGALFPGSKSRPQRSQNTVVGTSIATGATGLFLIIGFGLRVLGRMNRRGQLDDERAAAMVGAVIGVVIGGAVPIVLLVAFVLLVIRFGFFRPAAAYYSVAALGTLLLFVTVDSLIPHVDKPRAAQLQEQPLPEFPELGPGRELMRGVRFHEVRLPVPSDEPGHLSTLYVYVPEGEHSPESLPCIFIASAGAPPFTGMELGTADQPEHTPYAKAGFVVVAYEIDGYLADPENASDRQYLQAVEKYWTARAGLTNARNAIEFALARIPAVDPQKLFAAGHSSAGLQSLLLAANDPRLKASVAYAPVVDLEETVREDLPALRRAISDFDSLLKLASPRANESRIECPIFLFHARDDSVVPYQQSFDMAGRLRRAGKTVEWRPVPRGDHYDPMISRGIPAAINWLARYTGAAGRAGSAQVAGGGSQTSTPGAMQDSAAESYRAKRQRLKERVERLLAELDDPSPEQLQARLQQVFEGDLEDVQYELEELRTVFAGDQQWQKTVDSLLEALESRIESEYGSKASGRMSGGILSQTGPAGTGGSAVKSATRVGQLLERIGAENLFDQRKAIKELGRLEPASAVSDTERAKAVRTLNQLAEGDNPFLQEDAIRALATWGDATSVDVLLALLSSDEARLARPHVYATLGRLKDPRAALPVASKLGDFFDKDEARQCLRSMGPVAEDALISVAPSDDAEVCLAAIVLLGEVGTEKCIDVLRKAQKSRNPQVREAAKGALRSVRLRKASAEEA